VFWRLVELLVRLIYFRRFRAARRIGEAGNLLAAGCPAEALALLEAVGARLHQSLLPLYALVRGRILDALGRVAEAEEAFRLVVLTDPTSAKADLELAVLTGRQRRFDECREWLDRLEAKDDPETRERARGIRELVEQITSGRREEEFATRARAMSAIPLGDDGATAGLPPDLCTIDAWITRDPAAARERLDELALLIGQGEVARGARWRISITIDESVVIRADGSSLDPFRLVDTALAGGGGLSQLLDGAWRPPAGAEGSNG
jgi:tetratricopeptide (TPR) repeat protein